MQWSAVAKQQNAVYAMQLQQAAEKAVPFVKRAVKRNRSRLGSKQGVTRAEIDFAYPMALLKQGIGQAGKEGRCRSLEQ
jgi:hypothetical protein